MIREFGNGREGVKLRLTWVGVFTTGNMTV